LASTENLILGGTGGRVVAWQEMASLFDREGYANCELPQTTFTALRASTKAKNRLLLQYSASAKTLISNACFRGGDTWGKWVSADLQREVMLVLAGAGTECLLSAGAIGAAIAGRNNVEGMVKFTAPELHRALHALEQSGLVWKRDGSRKSIRFIRWDMLEPMIPQRAMWSYAPDPRARTLNEVLEAKKALLAQFNVDASKLIELLALPRVSASASGRVSDGVLKAILSCIACYDTGCNATLKEIAGATGLDPTTVQRALQALEGLDLIVEKGLGNQRVRFARWDNFAPLVQPVDETATVSTETVKPKKRQPTLRAVYDRHVKPRLIKRNRARSTMVELLRAVDAWDCFWPPKLQNVRRIRHKHLEKWQNHLLDQGLSACTVNRYLKAIGQILRAAVNSGIIANRPSLEQLPTRPATLWYMQLADMDKLIGSCDQMTWPRLPGLTPGQWWQAALVLYWIYGFRTQEVLAFGVGRRSLSWDSIDLDPQTPNPAGMAVNEWGWLSYVPQKQEWTKPDPLYLPLTKHARAAIDLLQCGRQESSELLFPWPRSQKQLYMRWRELQKLAGVATKGGKPFCFKHIRKSAATHLERHYRGLGAAVIGWADRDVSMVMSRHYAVNELMLVEQLASYPVPDAFDSLLSSATSSASKA
ncbi:MAG: helix-turn-helix domain-containing protein, partial [Planctomycetales bacterium]|nr:helix-turn-helix domain-containing protein [Planctomycetales bacterium]